MSLLLWDELLGLWQAGDFRGAHDWLNERWADMIKDAPEGEQAPLARFLQGLAFAALAFHFAEDQNAESAALFAADGLELLPRFGSAYAGIELTPVVDALNELHNRLPAPDSGLPIPYNEAASRSLRIAKGATG